MKKTVAALVMLGLVFAVRAQARADVISVNTDWMATPLGSLDVAGVQPASNWNNVDVSTGTVVSGGLGKEVVVAGLFDEAGIPTGVGMKLSGEPPNSSELNDGGTTPDYQMMDNGPRSIMLNPAFERYYMQMELTGLAAQFPEGYDVILYYGTGIDNPNEHENAMGGWGVTVVTTPGTYSADMTVTPFATPIQVPQNTPSGGDIITTHGWSDNKNDGAPYNFADVYRGSTDASVPGNYQVIGGQAMDTLTLTFAPSMSSSAGTYPDPSTDGFFDTYALLGFQIIGSTAQPMEMIVDNLDAKFKRYNASGGLVPINDPNDIWNERGTSDEWDGRSEYSTVTNAYATWDAPSLPFPGVATDYEVYVWYSSARTPAGTGFFDSDSAAEYTVFHADGDETFIVDQDVDPGSWVLLGTFPFTSDGTEYVRLKRTAAADGPTSADAVKWRWVPGEAGVGPIPEPGPLALCLLGCAGLVRKRRK